MCPLSITDFEIEDCQQKVEYLTFTAWFKSLQINQYPQNREGYRLPGERTVDGGATCSPRLISSNSCPQPADTRHLTACSTLISYIKHHKITPL